MKNPALCLLLNGLLDRYPGVNFSTNTQAFSQKGTNNIQIAPIILAQMQNNPDKRIEYEALIYDCAKLISSGAMDWAPAGSHVKAAGTIINADGSVSGWAITEDDNGDESREKTKLDKFVENQKGDVLIAWENEAITTMKSYPDEYEMITPSVSILAQPSVAIVDDNADANGTQEVSREYLNYLYTDDAQRLAAEYGYRPSNESILKEFSDRFDLNVKLYTIKDYGGWNETYKNYFDDGAMFDEIYGNE